MNMKKYYAMLAAGLMAQLHGYDPPIPERKRAEKTPSEQKKCKSCRYFRTKHHCSYPLNTACRCYEKRKKK